MRPALVGDAGVRHEDVDAAPAVESLGRERLELPVVADVGLDDDGLSARGAHPLEDIAATGG